MTGDRIPRWLALGGHPRLPAAIALLAVVLALPTLGLGLGADDHHFRMVLQGFPGLPELDQAPLDLFTFADGDAERAATAMERGGLPWWSAPTIRLSFWRPVAAATHWIDHELWGDWTVGGHLQNLLWFGVLAYTAALLLRRFASSPWVGGLAAVIYALDDARLQPVAWIAGRNALMSAVAACGVLIAHDRWRREGWTPGAFLAPLALAVGLACGESTVGVLGYLAAYAVLLDRGSWARRVGSLAPCGLVTLAWLAVYRASGSGANGSALYVDPLGAPALFAEALLEHLPVLLLDQFGGVNAATWLVLRPTLAAAYLAAAVATACVVFWTLAPLIARERTLAFWTCGMLLAAVPACAVFPQNRVLFIVGLGGASVIARLIAAFFERPGWLAERPRHGIAVTVLAPAWIVIHLIVAPLAGVLGSGWMALYDHRLNRVSASIPDDPAIAGERVVIVTLPSDILLHGIPYLRSSLRRPSPLQLQALHAGLGPVAIHRPDERTLVLDAEGSFVSRPWSQMFRDPRAYPFATGDTVRTAGFVARVLAVDAAARPTRVQFRFDEPLERASRHWLTWSDGALAPFDLPAVGGSTRTERVEVYELIWQNIVDFLRSGAWIDAHRLETGPLEPHRRAGGDP